jgi:ABC-type Mn2+/Zn2+ transport system ATPase subunit
MAGIASEALGLLVDASIPDGVKAVVRSHLSDADLGVDGVDLAGGKIYLRSIQVEGFRGVGPREQIKLSAGPGLTVIAGPNGSGKSSFAEALERVLTGTAQRWESGVTDEKEWRNVHSKGQPAAVRVVWRADGDDSDSSLKLNWEDGQEFNQGATTIARPGQGEQIWSATGWGALIERYPPLLSYTAFTKILQGKQAELFDVFNPLLGLGPLEQADSRIQARQKELESGEKTAVAARNAVQSACKTSGVPRLVALGDAIGVGGMSANEALAQVVAGDVSSFDTTAVRRLADLAPIDRVDIARLLEALVAAASAVASSESSDIDRDERVLGVLRAAMETHLHDGDSSCPVCGIGTLDDDWSTAAQQSIQLVEGKLIEVRAARAARLRASDELIRALPDPGVMPTVVEVPGSLVARSAAEALWSSATSQPMDRADFERKLDTAVDAVRAVRAEATDLLQRTAADEQPVIAALGTWATASTGLANVKNEIGNHREARKWLRACIEGFRTERLESLNEAMLNNWAKLRQTSRVVMDPFEMSGINTSRKLGISCSIDGEQANARSVLSQGELHAVGLSLFLPRALHPDSPFGFLVIDDPVQALDLRKVDGLAELLSEIAATRQVIVFTHDERLPEAINRLGLLATILKVERSEHSVVKVNRVSDAVTRALDEATLLSKDKSIPDEAALRSIAGSCRAAVEQGAVRRYRKAAFDEGKSVGEIDSVLAKYPLFWDRVSLGSAGVVHADAAKRARDLDPRVGSLLSALNVGAHDLVQRWDAVDLIATTRLAIGKLFPEVSP